MSCHHPNKAFWTGTYTENFKRDFVIVPGCDGNLFNVKNVKNHHVSPNAPMVKIGTETFLCDPIPIPCGKCIGCRMARSKAWTVRLVHESYDFPDSTYFVTLTYADDALPRKDFRRDITLFLKRLRRYTGRKFRYFYCFEYGEETRRPHFHLILYGDLVLSEQLSVNVFHSKDISDAWPYGLHEVSYADASTMAYTAGYVLKKVKDPDYEKTFTGCSTRPGLGFNYLRRLRGSQDYLVYGNFGSGTYSASIPQAYSKKLEDAPWYQDFKDAMYERAKDSVQNRLMPFGTLDEDLQGFRLDFKDYQSLDKRRISKL